MFKGLLTPKASVHHLKELMPDGICLWQLSLPVLFGYPMSQLVPDSLPLFDSSPQNSPENKNKIYHFESVIRWDFLSK